LSVIVLALMLWTADLGGKIRHPEIDSRKINRTGTFIGA
jgi:hypothetical protein